MSVRRLQEVHAAAPISQVDAGVRSDGPRQSCMQSIETGPD